MEVLETIRTRRGILKYKTTPVDDKTIDVVLGAARCAPSWANTQCWRFVVVRDKKIKSRLADTLLGDQDNPNPSIDAIKTVPVVIVACAEVGQSGHSMGAPEPDTDKGDYWYMFDVALAMQNMVLTACSLGLGTRYVGGIDAKKVAEILGVPAGFSVVAMTPLGYPVEDPEVRPRKELSEIVFNDRFGFG